MDEQERKEMIRKGFNAASEGYDRPALRFFGVSAKLHSQQMALIGNEDVLDAATGTGVLALELSERLSQGRVTGIDLSDGMLEQAQSKSENAGLSNIIFLKMDMTALNFPSENFDAISCAFGIFFVEDMVGQLKHLTEKLKIGGRITLASFGSNLFNPMADLFLKRIETFGVELPPKNWQRVDDEEKLGSLFEGAGLKDFKVERHKIGYNLENTEQWWDIVWYAGFRGLLSQLDAASLERFRQEHLDEVATLADGDGSLYLPIETLYSSGQKVR
jgi:ubiquinone/menaquinone biosynthesis C-methylase UbiE